VKQTAPFDDGKELWILTGELRILRAPDGAAFAKPDRLQQRWTCTYGRKAGQDEWRDVPVVAADVE
jgi:hypothetical protein